MRIKQHTLGAEQLATQQQVTRAQHWVTVHLWPPFASALVSAAVGVPALFGNDIETIVQFEAWEGDMDGHPQKDQLEQEAASAYLRVGLARPSIKLLRAALSRRPTSYEEARVIGQLIEAYVQLDEVNHAQEVMSFQLENHPRAPGLDAQLRDFGVAVRRTAGVDEAEHGNLDVQSLPAIFKPL